MGSRQYKNLGFCAISYHKDDSYFKKPSSINLIKKAFFKNKLFFRASLPRFKIIFIYSRKEMNSFWKQKTPDYMISFAKKNKIIIFSPSRIKEESSWKKSDFYSTLVHEINHLYYMYLTESYKPLWLSEGLATYLQNDRKKIKKVKIFIGALNKKFTKKTIVDYNVYHFFVYYLISRYKKQKIILFLKAIKKIKNAEKLIFSIFGKKLEELIKNANKF